MDSHHPDLEHEQIHLTDTIAAINEIIRDLEQDIDLRQTKAKQAIAQKEQISAYIHALIRGDHAKKIADFERARSSPYFGRVDFREDGAESFHAYYIGRTKIARIDIAELSDILVFDWRDPVSTIFYECRSGRASYEVLGRYTYSGDVRLKRQYKIEDGNLLAMSEDNVLDQIIARQQGSLIADPFLLDRLLQGAGERLKDIVTSIRAEQNLIIREPLHQVTVVQGVAGSGKSTIGLHRLSYLLYNEKLDPAKLLVVAPNKIFLDYISDLLPEIDVAGVAQTTFRDLAAQIIGSDPPTATRPAGRLSAENAQGRYARWKGRPEFAAVLENHLLRRLEKYCRALKPITLFSGQLTITVPEQLEKVMEGVNTPYNERLRSLDRYVRFRVNNFVEVRQARRDKGIYEPLQPARSDYAEEAARFLERYFAKNTQFEPLSLYADVFRDRPCWKTARTLGWDVDGLTEHSLGLLEQGLIEAEDYAPLCHLKELLDGFRQVMRYDHIVVDEGQDLSLFEYLILRRLSANTSFTVMGDIAQGVYAYRGLDSWDSLLREVFSDTKSRYFEVNHSYRSAKEIVELFNYALPAGRSKAIPVYEIGRRPAIEPVPSFAAGTARIKAAIEEGRRLGLRSIGILAASEEDCLALFEALHSSLPDLHLVTGDAARYEGGITLAPIALAKGLEFDGVILWNASARIFGQDPDSAKLLYVALSRAMYYLLVLYQGNLTPLLAEYIGK